MVRPKAAKKEEEKGDKKEGGGGERKRPCVCLQAEHNEQKEKERRQKRTERDGERKRDKEAKIMDFLIVPRKRARERDEWRHV